MTQETQIRRHRDGSINTAFYMAQGRTQRSTTAREMVTTNAPQRQGVIASLLLAFVSLPFWPGQG